MEPSPDRSKDAAERLTAGSGNGALGEPVRVFRVNIPNFIAGMVIGLLGIAVGLVGPPFLLYWSSRNGGRGEVPSGLIALCAFAFIWLPVGVAFLVWVTRTLFVRILVYDVGFVRTYRGQSDAFFWYEITAATVTIDNRMLRSCVVTRGDGHEIALRALAITDLAGLINLIKQGTTRDAKLCMWTTRRLKHSRFEQWRVDENTERVGRNCTFRENL